MEKVAVRFVKSVEAIVVGGETRSFRKDDLVDIAVDEAMRLLHRGLVLPGPQFGAPMKIEIFRED